ncbi:MAG: tyrosine-type recombinase/integrase [Eubacteriales bacterium]|nr:tyrosine-type recombinase/integrase [Eubacteriales bacterium]
MLKIHDAVDGVITAMQQRGCTEYTLKEIRWSVYTPIIRYHTDSGTDICSHKLLDELCQKQEERYLKGEISRKYYRSFVTASFRIRSYVNTGKVDFAIVKDTKVYKPGDEYQTLIDTTLSETGLSKDHQYKLSIVMRQFFCFYEKRHECIAEISDRDFIEFLPVFAKKNPHNMNCGLRALRYLIQYLNEHRLAKLTVDLKVFTPKAPPHRLIAPFTQDDISAMLSVIDNNSETPKRDAAIILLAFNSGLRCADIRNLQLHNIDWKKEEIRIVQKKTGTSLSAPLNGRTLNAIAAYILEERPKSEDSHVFLRARPPYEAIKSTSPLDYMIDKYCRLASIDKIEYRSFHSLRRAFGTELAIAEVPVTSISQMLGHRDMGADKAYLSFNNTQTSLCASDFSEVPITKGVYAFCSSIEEGGEQT